MRQKMQNPNLDREWFLEKMREHKFTVRGLAKMMDRDPSSVSLMLRGIRAITPDESIALGDLFSVTPQEILKRAGAPLPDESRTIKVTHYSNSDSEIHEVDDSAQDNFKAPYDTPVNAYAVQVRNGGAIDGWIFIVSGTKRDPKDLTNSGFCVFCNSVGERHFGFIRKGYKTGTFNVTYDLVSGIRTLDNVELTWASEILWVKPS